MEENTAKREVCKAFAIKMYPEEIERFKRIASEMDGVSTDRNALLSLMDYFENPKTVIKDNPELIKKNQELADEIDELQETIASQKAELAKHQEEAESRSKAMADKPENVFEVEVHPVAWHFLKQMSDKTKKTPGYILTDLFIRDLQNPRANNLPYIVASSEIKAKLEEYKKSHPEEYQGKKA
jgi:predicted nuclease with TOPRIM domain